MFMRNLATREIESVSGGFDVTLHGGFFDVHIPGEDFVTAYNWAVGETSDFFTWWDPMGYYDRC